MNDPILEMRGVSKSFFGIKALRSVDLTVYAGEIHALMGENGAGKSTLMKILVRRLQARSRRRDPHRGQAGADRRPARRPRGRHLHHLPGAVARPEPDVLRENIYLGRELSRAACWLAAPCVRASARSLKRLGADFAPSTLVAHLSMGQRQLVEIARALHARSKILIMDEPTTALSAGESERLFALIRQLRAEGLAIIYISHRMDEVYALGDRVTVLRDGRLVGALDKPDIRADTIVRMMVGRDVSSFYKKEHDPRGGARASRARSDRHGRRPARQGLLADRACGRGGRPRRPDRRRSHRACASHHSARRPGPPAVSSSRHARSISARRGEALDVGVAYLTEDRKALGLFLDMSCLTTSTSPCSAGTRGIGVLDSRPRQGAATRQPRRSRRWHSRAEYRRHASARCPAATSRRCCCRACLQTAAEGR